MPAFAYVSLFLSPRDGESYSKFIRRWRLKAVWYDAVYIGLIFTDDLQALAASSDWVVQRAILKLK